MAAIAGAALTAAPPSVPASSAVPTSAPDAPIQLDSVESAIAAIKAGEFVVVVDDMDRENGGDLVCAAAGITQQQMGWLIRHSSGYICICLPAQRLAELDIKMMVDDNQETHRTAYTVTCDYKHGTTTGISAHDRALTARKLADPTTTKEDFNRPGHLVPLRAVPGGVLERRGHTESSVDLCRLAGLPEAGIICELVKPDDPNGDMARRDDCFAFAKQWGLKMISIEQLEQYRREKGL
ncbi:SPOSA6832_00594 [Sporobolomyces salmonicolor]|uniref:3,4-dihydroxy-2-butanone 4-phosphate synthase n=1 Tax=Sporidiobolus salmonicolor TaxID=5005 RepID=A0A0D6EGE7_SPOSA|nr:SPOSA6832_00594 [Sporobolomyces salmonicolor]